MLYKGLALVKNYDKKITYVTEINDNDAKLVYVEIYNNKILKYNSPDSFSIFRPFAANNFWIHNKEIIQILEPKLNKKNSIDEKLDHIIINVEQNLKL